MPVVIRLARKIVLTLISVANHPLHRRRRWRAAWRFAVTQVAARLVPGDLCVPFPNQTRLLISPHMKGAAHFIFPGLCEFEEMCFVTHFLRPGDVFADAGANVGAFTILASGVAGARTVCFEPSPVTFPYLLANIRLNNLTEKVRAINAALGSRKGTLRLSNNLGTENHVCPHSQPQTGAEVDVTTLDDACGSLVPTLIKIDVEGFETEVLAGASKIMNSSELQALIVERGELGRRYGFDEEALHNRIRECGFISCSYSAVDRQIIQIPPESHGNIIYVRELAHAQTRVQSAVPFDYGGTKI